MLNPLAIHLDPALLSATFTFLGALAGGGASLFASVYTQRFQNRLHRIASEIAKREAVYAEFVMMASSSLINAQLHDDIAVGNEEQRLIGLLNRMRLFAPPAVVRQAEAVLRSIVDTSLQPGIALRQLAKDALSKRLNADPLLDFSMVCRADLDAVHRTTL